MKPQRTVGDNNSYTNILLKEIYTMMMYKFAVAPVVYEVTVGTVTDSYLCWSSKNGALFTEAVWLVLHFQEDTSTGITTSTWSSANKAFDTPLDLGLGIPITLGATTYYISASNNY